MIIKICDFSTTHQLCIVEKHGYQYATMWATERDKFGNITSPTIAQVIQAFKEDKHNFQPYRGKLYI